MEHGRKRIIRIDLEDNKTKELASQAFSARLTEAIINLNTADGFIVVTLHKKERVSHIRSCLHEDIFAPAMVSLNEALHTVIQEGVRAKNPENRAHISEAIKQMGTKAKVELEKLQNEGLEMDKNSTG